MIILDIQEFYELTLLDDTKTIQQKTVETLQIANKWEDGTSGPISFITNAANKVSKIGGLKINFWDGRSNNFVLWEIIFNYLYRLLIVCRSLIKLS